MLGEHLCCTCTTCYVCSEYTLNVLIFISSQKGPSGEQTLWPQNGTNTPPYHKHSTIEHNTMGTYFIIFEMALGSPKLEHLQWLPSTRGQIQTTTQHLSHGCL